MPALESLKFKNSDYKQEFKLWLSDQLAQTIADRHDLDRKWSNALIQWNANQPTGTASWPWEGAPDLEMPLTAIHSDPVYADLFQTLSAAADYWTPQALRPDRVRHVNAVREGMRAIERRHLKMKKVNGRALLDQVILGTAVYKNHWHADRTPRQDYLPDGTIGKVIKRISAPRIECVPLQRFYFPANAWDLDPDAPGGAQWKAQEFYKRPAELRAFAQGDATLPGFDREALKEVLKNEEDRSLLVEQTQRQENRFQPFENRRIRFFEVWGRYDVNGDGLEETFVCWFHKETMQILRILHNPFMHGRDPFHVTQYLPNFGIYGKGIAEIDEWAQNTATMLLNAQIHNVLLANTRMYTAPIGSNIQPGEAIYPGKIWMHAPDEKIGELRLGEVYPSLMNTLSGMMSFAEMRTGVSEIRQGNLTGLPSRTPATSLLSILREGNKRFDMILNNTRDVHSEMGLRMLQNVAQHYRDDPTTWDLFFMQALGQEDATLIKEVLSGSVSSIEESFGVELTATSAQVNKEVEKQSFVGLMQIVGQIGTQLVQVAQLIQNPQQAPPGSPMYETGAAMFKGGVQLLKQLLERFDIQNPSEYLGNLEAVAASLAATQNGMVSGGPQALGMGGMMQPQQPGAPMQGMPFPDPSQMGSLFGFNGF